MKPVRQNAARRARQAEAARLDAAIARILGEVGYGG